MFDNKKLNQIQKQTEYTKEEEEMEPVGIPSSYPFPEPLISKILKNIFVKKK